MPRAGKGRADVAGYIEEGHHLGVDEQESSGNSLRPTSGLSIRPASGRSGGRPTSGRPKTGSNSRAARKAKREQQMIYRHTEEDMEMFLQQSRYLLEAAIKRAGTQSRKKGWELHFETGVLGELAAVSQAAAKAAAAAAMTAAAASAATAAALRGAVFMEPMLQVMAEEAKKKPEPEPESEEPRWGYTKARSSKILKPLGFLGSDEAKDAPKKKKRYQAPKLQQDELPEVLKYSPEESGFNASKYAEEKKAKIARARAKRGSTIAVALPPIHKKNRKKGKPSKVGSKPLGSKEENDDEDEDKFPEIKSAMGSVIEEDEEESD